MAYSTDNPPAMITQRVGDNGGALWSYLSTDAATVVRADGYITNGDALGMKVGDIVIQSSSDASVAHIYVVNSVASGGAADLADGTAITATDTD
jgi:hypothetical protein